MCLEDKNSRISASKMSFGTTSKHCHRNCKSFIINAVQQVAQCFHKILLFPYRWKLSEKSKRGGQEGVAHCIEGIGEKIGKNRRRQEAVEYTQRIEKSI